MNLKRLLRILVLMLALVLVSAASASNGTSPFSVLQANTIYIDNRSGFVYLATITYMEIPRWGRFEPVESKGRLLDRLRDAYEQTEKVRYKKQVLCDLLC